MELAAGPVREHLADLAAVDSALARVWEEAELMLTVASTAGDVLYAVGLWTVLVIAPATITLLKGHRALFGLGFVLVGTVWYIAAFRLAHPDSFWARHLYGESKLQRSRQRYGAEETSRPLY